MAEKFVPKDNSFALFENDKKTKDEHPDFSGAANIVCTQCGHKNERWANAWAKTGNGKDYYSGSLSKEKLPANGNTPEPTKPKSNVRSIKRSPAPK